MKPAILLLLILLTSCAEIKAVVSTYGVGASDEALKTALWTICSASPVGAHNRRFKTDDEIAAVEVLCAVQ